MNDTTVITHALNNYYDRNLLKAARPALVHLNWGQVRNIPKGETETIKFRKYSLLTPATTALTEGVTPSGGTLAITDVTAVVAQYGDYLTLTDRLQFTSPDPVLTEAGKVQGQQAGNTLDRLMRTVLAAGTTIQYASTATAIGEITALMIMKTAEAKEAVRTLKNANARKITEMVGPANKYGSKAIPASYIGICSPSTTFDMKTDTAFKKIEDYADVSRVLPNEVGTLDEIRMMESTEAYVNSGAGAGSVDVHYTIVLAMDAYGSTRINGEAMKNIIKPLGSAGTADPLNQRATTGWKATFVGKILDQTFMVVIQHGVTA